MGSLGRRLERLEARSGGTDAERRAQAHREFFRRLTRDELEWLCEPGHRAQDLVPCPHVELVECGCRGADRELRGFEAHPELREEYERRFGVLLERVRGREELTG